MARILFYYARFLSSSLKAHSCSSISSKQAQNQRFLMAKYQVNFDAFLTATFFLTPEHCYITDEYRVNLVSHLLLDRFIEL